MGDILKAECSKCKSEWDLMLGAGLSHGRAENVIKEFPQEEASKLKQLMEHNEDWSFSFREAVCEACHNCIALPAISGGSREEVLIYGICPVCGSKDVKPVEAENICCPRCGSGRISMHITGHWD